jgi:hypothetical protein
MGLDGRRREFVDRFAGMEVLQCQKGWCLAGTGMILNGALGLINVEKG